MRGNVVQNSFDWWQVDLGNIHSVYMIRILFRDYEESGDYVKRQRGRMAGFSLYLSNTSKIKDGLLCYKDGPGLPPLNFTTDCVGFGRFVTFYNERWLSKTYPDDYFSVLTELCEVNVQGCNASYKYGSECNLPCPKNCQDRHCYITNGTCLGCNSGWTGETCNKSCAPGSYGIECKHHCKGHCMNNVPCNHTTGKCDRECEYGWFGIYCNEVCPVGTYDVHCRKNCSGNCWNGSNCNVVTGKCDYGCRPGYLGEYCKEECSQGLFGNACNNNCSGQCLHVNNETCHHVDGVCLKGCNNGFHGKFCDRICPSGQFGFNCSKTCSRNCMDNCSHTEGSCTCAPGWMGSPNCTTKCASGMYGINCQFTCSGHCAHEKICSRFDGHCPMGCKSPYVGLTCDYTSNVLSISVSISSTGALACVVYLIVKRCIFNTNKKQSSTSTLKEESKVEQSGADTNKDRVSYQQLSEIENKNYEELKIEGNPYVELP
ncbi:multiple epidermal growth factor-like domains protein 10 [Saccostrea cucullata]|uniref:multiple epidermal growth factor-like domains protein 10 n=1 Tax=Saccostrea cuccullata TaxID=36930 RepID=UPI002ED0FB9F